jgi:sulfonate dioxygenase
MSTLETITQTLPTLTLRPTEEAPNQPEKGADEQPKAERSSSDDGYRYNHLLPVFTPQTYPALTPFEHVDPGSRALQHPNPRAFLDAATSIVEITPYLGTDVRGVSLAQLDSNGRDQLALEVARRGLMVFRDQNEFIVSHLLFPLVNR